MEVIESKYVRVRIYDKMSLRKGGRDELVIGARIRNAMLTTKGIWSSCKGHRFRAKGTAFSAKGNSL